MFAEQDVAVVQGVIERLREEGDANGARALAALLGEVRVLGRVGRPPSRASRRVEAAQRPFLTTGEAARAIGVSAQTIKNWADAGHFPLTRLGGRNVVRREDLRRYLGSLERSLPVREPPWARDDVSQEELRSRLPADLVARVEAYHERIERGEYLSPADEAALRELEAEVHARSWQPGRTDGS